MLKVTFNETSQFAHVGWGYILVTFPVLALHRHFLWWKILLLSLALVTVATAIKEIWDAHGLEDTATSGSSWEDFGYWQLGELFGLCALVLAFHR